MSIFRINKNKNYTVMSNLHFKDKRLSLKAKGLLSQMLSLPDDWDYSMNGLAAINKENISAVKSALKELKNCGYLIITKKMPNETSSGRIEYIYDIFEQPKEKQEQEKQEIENLWVENQQVEKHRQLNIDKPNIKNKISNINNIYIKEFEEIWGKYPRKVGKDKALKSYIKARQSGTDYDIILNGVERYVKYCQGIDSQYIKHGSTWFNGSCWEDEYPAKAMYSGESSFNIDELDIIR